MQLLWISELNKNMMLLFLPPKFAHAQARNLGIFLGSSHSTTFHGQLIKTFGSFYLLIISQGVPGSSEAKKSSCQCRRCGFHPRVERIPWRRKWQPTPVFLPGKSHGQRSLAGFSPWGHKRVKNNLATELQLSLKTVLSTPNPALHPSLDWGIFCLPHSLLIK